MNKSVYAVILGLPLLLASCENQEKLHPDFDYQTVYFATRTPVQSITLGEDGEFDTSMDNKHCFQVYATIGGVNTNKQNRWADYVIDNSLIDQITFEDGSPIKALPSDYYQITSDPKRIYINKGSVMGAIDIQLTDKFFADPEAVNVCYVLPVRLVEASDSILLGQAKEGITAPNFVNLDDWEIAPRNYTLYAVKYKNKWHGTWLSRGEVEIDKDGTVTASSHSHEYWEDEDVHYLTSKALDACNYLQSHAVTVTLADGTIGEDVITCNVILTINEQGNISVSTDTEGCTATGSGVYKYHGAGNAWGALDRDLINLEYTYTIPYTTNYKTGAKGTLKVKVVEKLVSRDRQSKYETFSYVMK